MDILILGGAGQVGTELQAFPWPEGVRDVYKRQIPETSGRTEQ